METSGWDHAGAPTSLASRFFVDRRDWEDAPFLKGTTEFEPLPEVRNIMVTGGEGFIASWLVRHLVDTYPTYNVVSFDKLDYCSSLNNARMLEKRHNFRFFHGDVANPADVMKCLETYQIDTVFHLAARSHVDLSFGNSISFSRNNVLGTHVLLESVLKHGKVQRFIHISTDEVYGEVEKDAADLAEHSVLAPTNPYAATKAAAEMLVVAYKRSWQLPLIIVRLNNVYGPHQYPEKVIPKFINLLQRDRPLIIHGDGQHSRRYLYAGDAVDAFDTILHKGSIGQVYNVDSRYEITNMGLAQKLLTMFGKDGPMESWLELTRDRPFNDRRYAVDGSKLRKLGWIQNTSFEDGLTTTVNWYRNHPNWFGDITSVLTPFPVVEGDHVVPEPDTTPVDGAQKNGTLNPTLSASDSREPNGMDKRAPGELYKAVKKRKADALEG